MAQSRKVGWDVDSELDSQLDLAVQVEVEAELSWGELKLKQGMARDLQYACTSGSGNFVGAAAVRVCHNYLWTVS